MSTPQCVLITDDFLPHVGGSRIYCHRVATILEGRIAVVTRRHSGDAAFDSRLPYAVRRVGMAEGAPGLAVLPEALNCAALTAAAFGSAKGTGCVLAGEVTPSAFAALIVARLRRVPYGIFVHDDPLLGAGSVERSLRTWVLSRAGAIITSSTFAADRAHQAAPHVPVFLAPAGVDAAAYAPGAPDSDGLKRFCLTPNAYLLSVGRLVAYKNVSLLVRALPRLEKRNLILVVGGAGPERAALEAEAVALRVPDRVVFAGRVGQEELVNLYRGALAYVFPSRRQRGLQHEGIGMAALEAAACGAVVLASTQTSAGDFIRDGETGFLFDPEDLDGFVRLVDRVAASSDERARISASGSDLVRREFTWEKTARVVAEAIDFLIACPRD